MQFFFALSALVALAAAAPVAEPDLATRGVGIFQGSNSGIGSWFNAYNDGTNGNSWCHYPYNDGSNVIAISYGAMVGQHGGDVTAAAKAFCGLEVWVKTPGGKSRTMYIGDAFSDQWVRTPASIDIMHNAFNDLKGYSTGDKSDVIQNIQWGFTGGRSEQYSYGSWGN